MLTPMSTSIFALAHVVPDVGHGVHDVAHVIPDLGHSVRDLGHVWWSLLSVCPGVDFLKGLSPVSGSNMRLLSQIIETFFLSPWAQPLWISQRVSVSALAEPLTQMLRLVGSGLKFCK